MNCEQEPSRDEERAQSSCRRLRGQGLRFFSLDDSGANL